MFASLIQSCSSHSITYLGFLDSAKEVLCYQRWCLLNETSLTYLLEMRSMFHALLIKDRSILPSCLANIYFIPQFLSGHEMLKFVRSCLGVIVLQSLLPQFIHTHQSAFLSLSHLLTFGPYPYEHSLFMNLFKFFFLMLKWYPPPPFPLAACSTTLCEKLAFWVRFKSFPSSP